MKYTIEGYSQERAIELGLNLDDLIILRWIQDFYPLMSKKIIDNEEFAWINYSSLLEDLPILSFKNKHSLMRKLEKLKKAGLLKRKCVRNNEGVYSYIILTNKINILISNKNVSNSIKNDIPLEVQACTFEGTSHRTPEVQLNNPSIKKDIIKEKEKIFKKPTIEEIKQYCQERHNNINEEDFFYHYEARGWMIGKTKMKDWKAAIRTWERNQIEWNKEQKQEEKSPYRMA